MTTPVRKLSVPARRLTKVEIRAGIPLILELDDDVFRRPRTRGDCIGGLRPCPWVSCRHHLALEVTSAASVHLPWGDANDGIDLDRMPDTCSLDVADRGGTTLSECGKRLNVTRERVRQIEGRAIRNLVAAGRMDETDVHALAALRGERLQDVGEMGVGDVDEVQA